MKASPALPTAVNSMSSESPVRPAPDARGPRWISIPVQPAPEPPGRAAGRAADPPAAGGGWEGPLARPTRAATVPGRETSGGPRPAAVGAPEWVPWRDRLQRGDHGVGDLLPAPHGDERRVPVAVLGGDDVPAW